MAYVNYSDVLDQLQTAGLQIRGELTVGKFVRCKIVDGDAEKRGWYKLFEVGELLTGAFGSWRGADLYSMKIELPKTERKRLSADEMKAIRERQKAELARAKAETAARHERASLQASAWWRKLLDAGDSGYMAKKGFNATDLFGARVSLSGNLVVPVQDTTGKTWGLQVIYPTKAKGPRAGRDKDFQPPGLAKKGHFFSMGIVGRGGIVLLCEGFATGASLRMATGLPVIVAFDAGNLTPVAMAIHKAHRKDVRILVCADDDADTMTRTGKNPGVDHATMAAMAVDGVVVKPEFPEDRGDATDFNDLHCHLGGGLQAVRTQIEAAIAQAGWRVMKRMVGGNAQQGGRGPAKSDSVPDAVSIMTLDEAMERFIAIYDGRGKCVWDTWMRQVVETTQMTAILPAGVRGDDIKKHPTWQDRAFRIDQIGFDPTEKDTNIKLNTWRGWPMAPKKGNCHEVLDHLRYLTSRDENQDGQAYAKPAELYDWVLKWLALPLQRPGAKMRTAIVMHGEPGTGKDLLFRAVAKIYGHMHPTKQYSMILTQSALESKFNLSWAGKLFCVGDEVMTATDRWQHKNELKEIVTSEVIRIEGKFLNAYTERNLCNFVFLSNEFLPLLVESKDRRYCVIETPQKLEKADYAALAASLDDDGVAAFYEYLLGVDLGDFNEFTEPPMTQAKRELILQSMSPRESFLTEWMAGGVRVTRQENGRRPQLPFGPIITTVLFAVYRKWSEENGVRYPGTIDQLRGAAHAMGWKTDRVRISPDRRERMLFPAEMEITAAFKAGVVCCPAQGDLQPQGRWLEACIDATNEAVHGQFGSVDQV
jgi:putative DNA primase/helicase